MSSFATPSWRNRSRSYSRQYQRPCPAVATARPDDRLGARAQGRHGAEQQKRTIEKQREEATHEPVPIREALVGELGEIRAAYPDADVTVDGEIPAVSVVADEVLDSVFHNLLQNAIQHNDAELPAVTVTVAEGEQTVTARVADNGPGIPDDRKDDIFGRGEKGLESGGTGIGLYLVEALVESYGGEVWIEDNEPTGSVFVVRLQAV